MESLYGTLSPDIVTFSICNLEKLKTLEETEGEEEKEKIKLHINALLDIIMAGNWGNVSFVQYVFLC